MRKPTRRAALESLSLAALSLSFANLSPAFGAESQSPDLLFLDRWLRRLQDNASRLAQRQISGLRWQEQMDAIYTKTPIAALKTQLNFDRLRLKILDQMGSDRGEWFHRVELPGGSAKLPFGSREPHRVLITKVAHVRKGRSIPPHGHSNMASAFLCLSGEFSVRQYDRLEDQQDHMIVRQTRDEAGAGVGTWSSISDYRNNVHWLTANSDDCFLFTTKMIHLESDRPLVGRINIDVLRAESLGRETLKAPKISASDAAERY
jgi:hypothetical protein